MEKVHRQGMEICRYLQNEMEEAFQKSCEVIQTIFDTDAAKIWGGVHDAVCECLKITGSLQQQSKKGDLLYLAFSQMRNASYSGRLELRVDALDDGFYLDVQEASAQYHAAFLEDRYTPGITIPYCFI